MNIVTPFETTTDLNVMSAVKTEILTPASERWQQFCNRLSGAEGVNFREGQSAYRLTWNCQEDRRRSIEIMNSMGGIDVEGTLNLFDEYCGVCDCAILFNVEMTWTERQLADSIASDS